MSDELNEKWLNDYRARREGLYAEVKQATEQMFEIDSRTGLEGNTCTNEARRHAQMLRPEFKHPFCLVLWSGRFGEEFFREIAQRENVDPEEARALLSRKAENFVPRIGTLTERLDSAGYYTLLIWPEDRPGAPPQPLCIELPEVDLPADGVAPARPMNLWFYFFTHAIDLAQAIIVETNYSKVLYEELETIHKRGLEGRLLFFDNSDELYRDEDDRRWPLESVGDAVEFAAAQPVRESRPA